MAVTVLMEAVATMARDTVRRGLLASSTRCMVESRPAQMAQPGPTRPVMKHMASLQPVLLSSRVQTAAESCLVGDRIRHTIGMMKQPAREPTTGLVLVLGYFPRRCCICGRTEDRLTRSFVHARHTLDEEDVCDHRDQIEGLVDEE
jgi:hypothetical protein